MAEQNDNSGPSRPPGGSGTGGGGSGSSGVGGSGGGGAGGAGGGNNRNRNRNRSRNRNKNRPAGSAGSGGQASGGRTGGAGAGAGAGANGSTQRKGQSGGGGQQRQGQGQGQRQNQRQGSNRGGSRNRSRSSSRPRTGSGQPRTSVALAPPPAPPALDVRPSLGAPQVYPGEVAANRRRAIRLCTWTAVVPALLIGILLGVSVDPIVGIVALIVVGAAVMYGLWRLAPAVALRRIGAVPIDEHDDPRLFNLTDGLCATFGLAMPMLHVVEDEVPNACALGRDARRSDLVVTTGLLRRVDPIELEGVIAHELAHVERGDNGVSCVGITLATLFGGERTLRRCVGESREYRADVVGASAVLYPRGLLAALRMMIEAPSPREGSLFASPSRFGSTRWVWIDPSVGHRDDPLVPGDLDATSVRAAALSEW
jgi:Peptidase family M48